MRASRLSFIRDFLKYLLSGGRSYLFDSKHANDYVDRILGSESTPIK